MGIILQVLWTAAFLSYICEREMTLHWRHNVQTSNFVAGIYLHDGILSAQFYALRSKNFAFI